ncbi:MAG TPA: ABC transporter permease [Polyangia bacterium]|jgi:peptide/nickel transport system permease protein|nr:ABC transporter permease [Polyangia bacterium]
MRYLLRRLGLYTMAAWAAVTLGFVLPRLMPGDPATTLLARLRGKLSPEALTAMREALGFAHGGLLTQYAAYWHHLLRGELGLSIAYYPVPVGDVIATGLGWTLALTGAAVVIAFVIGTLLGALAAWRRGGILDTALPPALALLGAVPYFWLAMLMLLIFGYELRWFPLGHAYSLAREPNWTNLSFIGDVIHHAMLPAATLILATLGGWMLGMRNTMVALLDADFIRLAWAKGLPPTRILLRYAARNALLPSVTGFGMALGFVLSGSLLTEIVFSYPGLGYLLVQAVRNQDYALMQGLFLLITLAVLAANFAVDVMYVWLDPRTRADG